jgi:hypothetical protein
MDCTLFWCFLAYAFSVPLLIVYGVVYGYEFMFNRLRTGLEAAIFDSSASMACGAQRVEKEDPLTWFAL